MFFKKSDHLITMDKMGKINRVYGNTSSYEFKEKDRKQSVSEEVVCQ